MRVDPPLRMQATTTDEHLQIAFEDAIPPNTNVHLRVAEVPAGDGVSEQAVAPYAWVSSEVSATYINSWRGLGAVS